MFEKIQDADCAFVLDLLQHAVNDNVCSGAPHACTEEQSDKQYKQTRTGSFWPGQQKWA